MDVWAFAGCSWFADNFPPLLENLPFVHEWFCFLVGNFILFESCTGDEISIAKVGFQRVGAIYSDKLYVYEIMLHGTCI